MTIIEQLKKYYADLLIIQYSEKAKARATIELITSILIPANSETDNLLFNDIEDGFNIEDSIGAQLDLLGKYIGFSRSFIEISYDDGTYFAFTEYSSPTIPSDVEGFLDYSTIKDGLILTYDDVHSDSKLNDADYRMMLKLKIVLNNANGTTKQINDSLYSFFGDGIKLDSGGTMKQIYFFDQSLLDIVTFALQKNLLPKPAGVQIIGVIPEVAGGYLSLIDYNTPLAEYANYAGFRTYVDPNVDGQILSYDDILGV